MNYNFRGVSSFDLQRALEIAEVFPNGYVVNEERQGRQSIRNKHTETGNSDVVKYLSMAKRIFNKGGALPKRNDFRKIVEDYQAKAQEEIANRVGSVPDRESASDRRISRKYYKAVSDKSKYGFLRVASVFAGAILLPLLVSGIVTGILGAVFGATLVGGLATLTTIGLGIAGGVAGNKLWGKLFQGRQERAQRTIDRLEDQMDEIRDRQDIREEEYHDTLSASRSVENLNEYVNDLAQDEYNDQKEEQDRLERGRIFEENKDKVIELYKDGISDAAKERLKEENKKIKAANAKIKDKDNKIPEIAEFNIDEFIDRKREVLDGSDYTEEIKETYSEEIKKAIDEHFIRETKPFMTYQVRQENDKTAKALKKYETLKKVENENFFETGEFYEGDSDLHKNLEKAKKTYERNSNKNQKMREKYVEVYGVEPSGLEKLEEQKDPATKLTPGQEEQIKDWDETKKRKFYMVSGNLGLKKEKDISRIIETFNNDDLFDESASPKAIIETLHENDKPWFKEIIARVKNKFAKEAVEEAEEDEM